MSLRLTIVMPCYNCASTLLEAVDSCYTQNLSEDEFEIVMVNDASTDQTRSVMDAAAKKYKNVSLYDHPKNLGGGAARNTGIRNSRGPIIYCLDGDNIFAPASILPMLQTLESQDIDGVTFHERRFFFGKSLKNYTTHVNTILDRSIVFTDLFTDSNTLLDNFFYRRSAYDKTTGYPEHHGFDTQCFEMRFLSAGNRVTVQPDSVFYHRQGTYELSYFERVHAAGLFSVNFMLIFEDIFHLFSEEMQHILIHTPLFEHNKSFSSNILNTVKSRLVAGSSVFIPDIHTYLIPNSRQVWLHTHTEPHRYRELIAGLEALHQDAAAAFSAYGASISKTKENSTYLQFLLLRIQHQLAGSEFRDSIKHTLTELPTLQVRPIHAKGGKIVRRIKQFRIAQLLIKSFR